MEEKEKDKILLESGTNELEIIEFTIEAIEAGQKQGFYGLNVGKVREIIKTPSVVTGVTKAHPSVEGIINLRGKLIPIINLPKWLGIPCNTKSLSKIIVAEFNKVYNGFLVSNVLRIHRVSWENIEPPNNLMTEEENECITGTIKFDNKILMMIDFEKIIADINPALAINQNMVIKNSTPTNKTILFAEDSGVIAKKMKEVFNKAGFKVIHAINGEDAIIKLDSLISGKAGEDKNVTDYVNLIISDIEMPKMDGLHLLKTVKGDKRLSLLPVIMFSSMASQDNVKKWQNLGAVDFISKPDINILIESINKNIL